MKKRKLLKVWVLVLIDICAIAVALCVFAYFDHVRPQSYQTVTYSKTTLAPTATPEPNLTPEPTLTPEPESTSAEAAPTPEPTQTDTPVGVFDFPGVFTDGEVEVTDTTYRSADIFITVTNVVKTTRPKQSYFIEDIYIRSIDCMQTAFANDTYGKSVYEDFMTLSNRVNSVASINTDMYGWGSRTGGLVIRNGVLYREKIAEHEDMCVIYRDGTMDTILTGTGFDAQQLIDDGAWQAFSFGPSLLDGNGNVRDWIPETSADPRTVIGMVEPGHYIFVVFDGRQDKTYAVGYTYRECAEIMSSLGCKVAFNLDGGGSTQMSFCGELVNQPYENGRNVSDILYIAEFK